MAYLKQKDKRNKDWIWWKHGVIYHIYPLSFYDSDGDGKGDLKGIIQKLGYLEDLGVDAIWLSPVFQSPMKDFGYDVSDYYSIDSVFGNLKDFRNLLKEAHKRNIRVILDMVLNHTSSDHSWFQKSRANKKNSKRNWYIWENTAGKKKPNNWKTAFGGNCWEYDQKTKAFYLHSFLKEQPDLNWRNEGVKKEMFGILRYWLDMGVDGFRFDVINFIVKDKKLRNNPFLYWMSSTRKIRTRNHPKSYKIIKSLRKLLDKYPDKMGVGEIYTLPPGDPELAASYLLKGNNSLHLTFDFSIFFVPWNSKKYFRCIQKWQTSVPAYGWPCNVFSNHDLFRAFNRRMTGSNPEQKARLLALMLMTLKGTPFIYYGEEIGMKNSNIPRNKIQDPLGKKYWPVFKGRDRARTPMQWNNSNFAGFSQMKPWLPVAKNSDKVNVDYQNDRPESLLNLYRELIRLRKSSPALHAGEWIPDCPGTKGILSFTRKFENEKLTIVINFKPSRRKYRQKLKYRNKVILSTIPGKQEFPNSEYYVLLPYEGIIVQYDN